VNELAIMCDKLAVDVWEVIEAAATKPFGFMKFAPGPGLGGHCIPIDPLYLSWKLRERNYTARFIELADQVNSHMPDFVIEKATLALNARRKCVNGSRVLVLGVAYKRNVRDVRESPALDIIRGLRRLGAEVDYHDPHVPSLELDGLALRSVSSEATPEVARYDLVLIATDHEAVDYARVVREAQCVLDCRDATRDVVEGREKIVKL
jgi:UDP-N-acetyl-D-glucosamine dehydrogenase